MSAPGRRLFGCVPPDGGSAGAEVFGCVWSGWRELGVDAAQALVDLGDGRLVASLGGHGACANQGRDVGVVVLDFFGRLDSERAGDIAGFSCALATDDLANPVAHASTSSRKYPMVLDTFCGGAASLRSWPSAF